MNLGSEWDEAAAKLLLDKYESYMASVGPMKRFKKKKNMWEAIALDLQNILNFKKTAVQCENRYKTVMKRKTKAVEKRHRSGESPETIPFQDEIEKINALDDSIEPEVNS